mmetsp:Transcript_36673/g.117785  ORF Transcript_36673/g.117785 Transcript_36673/m.117785 type:complete len:215 (+) Transcript_36673:151-795(+)|eukprot:scaffold33027_cov124-Isochrysis_galbana.AAC.3
MHRCVVVTHRYTTPQPTPTANGKGREDPYTLATVEIRWRGHPWPERQRVGDNLPPEAAQQIHKRALEVDVGREDGEASGRWQSRVQPAHPEGADKVGGVLGVMRRHDDAQPARVGERRDLVGHARRDARVVRCGAEADDQGGAVIHSVAGGVSGAGLEQEGLVVHIHQQNLAHARGWREGPIRELRTELHPLQPHHGERYRRTRGERCRRVVVG